MAYLLIGFYKSIFKTISLFTVPPLVTLYVFIQLRYSSSDLFVCSIYILWSETSYWINSMVVVMWDPDEKKKNSCTPMYTLIQSNMKKKKQRFANCSWIITLNRWLSWIGEIRDGEKVNRPSESRIRSIRRRMNKKKTHTATKSIKKTFPV